MAGNNKKGMVIQERDRHLLRELTVMRVIDREQAKIVAGFHSTTRVNARLLALTRAGLLKRFFLGTTASGRKALYALSKKGALLVDVPLRGPRRRNDASLVADYFLEHQLTINRVYCELKYGTIPLPGIAFKRWVAFHEPLTEQLRLIPDGYFELETPSGLVAAFLEIDLGHERLAVWKEKAKNYLRFAVSGDAEKCSLHRPFRVLVLAPSERRVRSIRATVAVTTDKIFWFANLESIERDSLFASLWLRPRNDERLPLIKELP